MTDNFGAKALQEMSPEERKKLILELGQHVAFTRHLFYWRTRDPNDLPEGETVDSIVSLAITKLMIPDWNWDPVKYPDLKKYLKMQVKNLLSDLSVKKDNTLFTSAPDEESSELVTWHKGSEKRDPTADWMARHDLTPEEALLAKVKMLREQEAIELLKEEAKDDSKALRYIQAIENGYDKRREIAAEIGVDVEEVSLIKNRVDRLVPKVTKKLRAAESK